MLIKRSNVILKIKISLKQRLFGIRKITIKFDIIEQYIYLIFEPETQILRSKTAFLSSGALTFNNLDALSKKCSVSLAIFATLSSLSSN